MTMQRRHTGQAGDREALAWLRKSGYQIEQLNYRCPLGEIDIVAREGETIVFVEVRTRTGTRAGRASESITPAKGRRLKKLALYYLQDKYGRDIPCRLDLIAIQLNPAGEPVVEEIEHIRGILF